MKLNKKFSLDQKRKMAGSYVHLGSFLDSSPSAVCTSIKKGHFGSNAVELVLELLSAILKIATKL